MMIIGYVYAKLLLEFDIWQFCPKGFVLEFDKKRDFLIKLITLFGGKVVESLNF